MYRTLIIQLCQGKDSFQFYGTFKTAASQISQATTKKQLK